MVPLVPPAGARTDCTRRRLAASIAAAAALVLVAVLGARVADATEPPATSTPTAPPPPTITRTTTTPTTATPSPTTTVAPPPIPVDQQSFADPAVVHAGVWWIAYATQHFAGGAASQNVPMRFSVDLQKWANAGDALPVLPPWATPNDTWAPSVVQAADGTWRLYFAARTATGQECIGVGLAPVAWGPYTSPAAQPLVCQTGFGGDIDPSTYTDLSGTRWLVWKNDGNSNGHAVALWAQPLAANGAATVGSPTRLLTATAKWEHGIVESPDLVALGGTLYLFYSGGSWDRTDYATGYATCAAPAGPCTKVTTTSPIEPDTWAVGDGGLSTFALPDGRTGIAWSGWTAAQVGAPSGGVRDLHVGHIRMTALGPALIEGLGPDPVVAPTAPTAPTVPSPQPVRYATTTAAPRVTAPSLDPAPDAPPSSFPWPMLLGTVATTSALVIALARRRSKRVAPT